MATFRLNMIGAIEQFERGFICQRRKKASRLSRCAGPTNAGPDYEPVGGLALIGALIDHL